MIKIFTILSLISSNLNVNYLSLESIVYYQSNDIYRNIVFNFESDSLSNHTIKVYLDFYNEDNLFIRTYSNELSFIGNKQATAKIKYENFDKHYVIVRVEYKGKFIVNNAKINFYKQEECLLNDKEKYCTRIYKSYFKSGENYDEKLIFNMDESIYNKYLVINKFDISQFYLHTNYIFNNTNAYLILEDEIENYQLTYNKGYYFPVTFDSEKESFKLFDSYYLNLKEFSFSEDYIQNALKVKSLYFPFSDEFREYHMSLLIEGTIKIRIDFKVNTLGNLLGECNSSKYCLVRI